ncbi:MAG TPA: hypothetical protein VFP91_14850 [Vicinamibacterales bacterium]|jgi:uncharacterized Zn finger protein|nr:hypothetical protein [Vicinamibacterales bacterium]
MAKTTIPCPRCGSKNTEWRPIKDPEFQHSVIVRCKDCKWEHVVDPPMN